MKPTRNFRQIAMLVIAFCLLIASNGAIAEVPDVSKGIISLDFPNAPQPKIEINLDHPFIKLIAKTAEQKPKIAELMAMLDSVYLRGYRNDVEGFDHIVRHCEQVLKREGWEVIVKAKRETKEVLEETREDGAKVTVKSDRETKTIEVNALRDGEKICAVFVVIADETETIFVNILVRINPDRIGELLANLNNFGLNLPQLKSLEDESSSSAKPIETDDSTDTGTENPTPPLPATRFVDRKGKPIHEIEIKGNQEISTAQIKNKLEMGPDDFNNSVKLMKSLLPFERVRWGIHEREGKRIATITVIEKDRVNSNFSLSGGFNRIDGWRLGPALELSKEPDLWTPPRLKLFGELTYGFSNKAWNYTLGTQTAESLLSRWHLTISARIHRLTAVRDQTVLPHNGEQFTMAFLYGGDYRDYYERDGSELSVRWHPENSSYSLRLTALDENHWSLGKTTDWSLFRRDAIKTENTSITPGHLRSATLRYDFKRNESGRSLNGLNHAFAVEHGDAGVGSDFDFTRFEADFRKYQPIGGAALAVRLKVGVSRGALPIQRQFIIGGPGTLRGYDLYEFSGNHMVLYNLEYHFSAESDDPGFLFLDAGHTWDALRDFALADVKINVGVGLAIANDEDFSFRLTLAQALEREDSSKFKFKRKPRLAVRWTRMF